MATIGLVLTGGGARAAYQVGALRAIAEIVGTTQCPFRILVGVSAGALNCVTLSTHADDFQKAVDRLWTLWSRLEPERVYRTDTRAMMSSGARWLKQLSGGGMFQRGGINSLLDTAPLGELIKNELPLERLAEHFAAGRLHGVAVTSTNYQTGTAMTFYDGAAEIQPWVRSTRIGVRQPLRVEHVMASSAIPIFFPPVTVDGAFHGDGCIRMTAPCSPAIHLGADRVLAIGIRYFRSADETLSLNQIAASQTLSLSEIGGVLLNAVFLDSLESDVERLERINRTITLIPTAELEKLASPLRPIPVMVLRPTLDLGTLAADQAEHFPLAIRYLLRGIGVDAERGGDLLSYLAFEPNYIGRLLSLGYRDTIARKAELVAFLST